MDVVGLRQLILDENPVAGRLLGKGSRRDAYRRRLPSQCCGLLAQNSDVRWRTLEPNPSTAWANRGRSAPSAPAAIRFEPSAALQDAALEDSG